MEDTNMNHDVNDLQSGHEVVSDPTAHPEMVPDLSIVDHKDEEDSDKDKKEVKRPKRSKKSKEDPEDLEDDDEKEKRMVHPIPEGLTEPDLELPKIDPLAKD